MPNPNFPVALTIAGFDPSGGAGVVADLKTFTAFGCWATAAVTSLTFQNTLGVFGAAHQTAETVREQVLPVTQDFAVAAVKTGMLPTREIIEEVARLCRETALPAPVVDPVARSTSGYDLIDDAALRVLIEQLFPCARIVTPNLPEAERITGLKLQTEQDLLRAAHALRDLGARAALVKGGHLEQLDGSGKREAVDVLLDEDGELTILRGAWIDSTDTHGTGCTLAAAIAAGLAHGRPLVETVRQAKDFVANAIRQAPGLGQGHGPVNPNHQKA
jgi:hydroxymethylpyrimidine kinase/phosphomethylpyrimidine kinase